MANSTKIKVPLNINWDSTKNVWHIMVLSDYIEKKKKTLIASCQYHRDKERRKKGTAIIDLHRDWFDKPMYKFPDGTHVKHSVEPKHPDLNFKNVCSTCVSKTNVEDFKVWLITQKLKYL